MIKILETRDANASEILFISNENEATTLGITAIESIQAYKKVTPLLETQRICLGIEWKEQHKTFDPFHRLDWFELGAALMQSIKHTNINSLHIDVFPSSDSDLQTFLLGIAQANYEFDTYLPKKKEKEIGISLSNDVQNQYNATKFKWNYLDSSMRIARNMVNETPEEFNPKTAVDFVKTQLRDYKHVSVVTMSYDDLELRGMQGITFVGRASRYKPQMVHVTLKPKGVTKKKIVLVGKGLTYDCGGLDIKYGGSMRTMKMDMGGSAAMFGVINTFAQLQPESTEIHWITAYAENMIDGSSYKADDIVTTYSGQTVEVYNTDAEGRMTLADMLAYATELNPDIIVDAATLTGAAIRAWGHEFISLMSNDFELYDQIQLAMEEVGEWCAPTPLWESLRSQVKGDASDLINTSKTDSKEAGHITAGLFLSHFVDQKLFRGDRWDKIDTKKEFKWAHLDIAGPAYNEKKNKIGVSGATGSGIRGLVYWIDSLDM